MALDGQCRAYLWALDATLPEPFLTRHPNGALCSSPIADGDAEGTMEVVEMELLDDDDDDEGECSEASSAVRHHPEDDLPSTYPYKQSSNAVCLCLYVL